MLKMVGGREEGKVCWAESSSPCDRRGWRAVNRRAGAHHRQCDAAVGPVEQDAGRLRGHQPCRLAGPQSISAWRQWQRAAMVPTVNDVPEALGIEKVTQPCHLVLQLPDEFVVGVLVDDSIAADLLGTVSVPGEGQGFEQH